MNWETFQAAYLSADQATKDLIDSEVIPNAIDMCVAAGLLSEDRFSTVLRVYPLVVLRAITVEQAINELATAGITQANTVIQSLNTFLTTANTNSVAPQPSNAPAPDQYTEHTSTNHTVQPVRTMAGDMAEQQHTPAANQTAAQAPAPAYTTPAEGTPAAVHYPPGSNPADTAAAITPPPPPPTASPAANPVTPIAPHTPPNPVSQTPYTAPVPQPASTDDIPHNLPTTPAEPPTYTSTQEAILRERPAQTTPIPTPPQPQNPQVYNQPPSQTPPTPYQPSAAQPTTPPTPPPTLRQQQNQSTDPDEIRWGSAN